MALIIIKKAKGEREEKGEEGVVVGETMSSMSGGFTLILTYDNF